MKTPPPLPLSLPLLLLLLSYLLSPLSCVPGLEPLKIQGSRGSGLFEDFPREPSIYPSLLFENDFEFDIGLLGSKEEQLLQVDRLITHLGLWAERNPEQGILTPSIGCALEELSSWWSSAPPSFCSLSPLLVYSEQHSGTTLLTDSLFRVPSIVGIHELFCCEKHCTANRTQAIKTFRNLLCALKLPRMGIKTVTIGLQFDQFWRENPQDAVFLPKEMGASALILHRNNYLARFLAGPAFHQAGANRHLSIEFLKNLPVHVRKHRDKFEQLYCSLKAIGVRTMITSYEELTSDYEGTMKNIIDFVGTKRGEKWELNNPEQIHHSHHVSVVRKIENLEEAWNYVRDNLPEYLCLFEENCVWYPMNCTSYESQK